MFKIAISFLTYGVIMVTMMMVIISRIIKTVITTIILIVILMIIMIILTSASVSCGKRDKLTIFKATCSVQCSDLLLP
jgi:uncharacterized membrane protein